MGVYRKRELHQRSRPLEGPNNVYIIPILLHQYTADSSEILENLNIILRFILCRTSLTVLTHWNNPQHTPSPQGFRTTECCITMLSCYSRKHFSAHSNQTNQSTDQPVHPPPALPRLRPLSTESTQGVKVMPLLSHKRRVLACLVLH
jgi:hypothetical protein